MQTLDIRFLHNLKQKLAANNRRSIYLNALPERYLTRLDLCNLDALQADSAKNLMELLFSNPRFEFSIKLEGATSESNSKIARRLNAITIENNDHYEDHGTKTFGVGYPILLLKDPKDASKTIKAPLFIWSLDIERDFNNENHWIIRREENFSVTTNSVLATFLRNHASIELQPMYDQMLEDNILDKDELAEMVHLHVKQLNPAVSDRTQQLFRQILDGPVMPIKTLTEIENLPLETAAVLWSGIFGLFRSQKDSIIKDLDYFIDNIQQLQPLVEQNPNPSDPNKSSFMKHSFTMLETDPSQQHFLNSLDKGKNLVLQGPPGTGKSQTLAGIIANTLSNAGTCLVVCEKKNALDVIYKNLQKMGLEELAIVIEDVHRDRSAMVDSVRIRSQHQHQPYRVSPTFIRLLQSSASNVQRLQAFHKKLQQPLLGENTWTDVVGQFLDSNQNNDKQNLSKFLKVSDFEFKPTELDEIKSVLHEGELLYKQLGTLNHPLNGLHDRFFRQANSTQVELDAKKALDNICGVVQAAQRDAFTYLFEYEELIEKHFSDIYLSKLQLTASISELIQAGLAQSKSYFKKDKGLFSSLIKRVSDKYQKLEEEKVSILETFYALQKYHAQYNYFSFQFMDTSDHNKLDFAKLLEHVSDYKMLVYEWHEGRGEFVQNLIKELGPGKIYKYINFEKRVAEITKNLESFEENFAKSQVFKVDFKFVTKGIRKRLTQIEELDENLKKLQKEFNNFADYHALKFFWLTLSSKQKAAMQALVEVNPKDWAAAFTSWYLSALLAHHEDEFVPNSENYNLVRSTFTKELQALQELLVGHTLQYWRGKQTQAVQEFQKQKAPLTLHSLYNTRTNNSNQRTPIHKIIETSTDVFTSFFPVLMVSPAVCSSILPLYPNLFDLVIFDEASQLNLEDSFAALVRGKYKIISGDSQQLPPPDSFQSHYKTDNEQDLVMDDEYWNSADLVGESINYLSNSESLLEFGLSEGSYHEAFLEMHYRSQHPYLFDFSNAAFYGNRLTSLPATKDYNPIEFKQIDGVYDNYSNLQEAEAIVAYLLELVQENEPCPSVAIASFNLQQRNLILSLLHQEASKNQLVRQKLSILFDKGLFVKNLENIQGEERDLLIISTTFGIKKDGIISSNFGPICHQDGYKLLNVIITRAKQKVVVFNSIPSTYLVNYEAEIRQNGNTGKGILFAYLAYAKAVSDNDNEKRKAILKLLFSQCKKKPLQALLYKHDCTAFEKQVVGFLKQEFPTIKIQTNYAFGGFELPIAIFDSNNKVVLAFYYDVYHDEFSEEAYAWDLYHEEFLQKMTIKCHRIWSKEWWGNLKLAQQKLVNQINA